MRIFAMVVIALLSGQVAAQVVQSDVPWVGVRRAVAPIVPTDVLVSGVGSQLDAIVRVGPDGRLQEVLSVSSSPSSPGLEATFRSALARWVFRIDANSRCEPTTYEGRVQVSIQITKGKPTTRVFQPPRSSVRTRVPGFVLTEPAERAQLMESLSKTYPISARRVGAEADLLVDVEYLTETGQPVKVTPVVVDLIDGSEAPELIRQFSDASVQALSMLRFKSTPGTGQPAARRCIPFSYRLSGTDHDSENIRK